jgi:uncharacterized protein with von Willebrand factor type A (vWA) domain
VKEYRRLLEALRAGVLDDEAGPAWTRFYFLARAALVKDEAHFDKFDRAFSAYFKGVRRRPTSPEVPLRVAAQAPSSSSRPRRRRPSRRWAGTNSWRR